MRWLVLGSSPDAIEHVERAGDVDASITTNRGGLLIQPTHYFLSDYFACHQFHDLSVELQIKGARLVTLQRLPSAIRARNLEHFDEFVRNGIPYEPFRLSGLWCLEYAIRNGATEVVMAGMQGNNGDRYYFDGSPQRKRDLTAEAVQPVTQALVDKYPGVLFSCFGPNYSIQGENWHCL